MRRMSANGAQLRRKLAGGIAIWTVGVALGMAGPAMAQETASGKDNADRDAEIVVTGTLVRGIAPAGTNVVSVDQEAVESSGATTVTELLTDVPQFGAFNDLQTLSGGSNFVTTNRPNLRNLPGYATTGTSTTLLLVDGHRVVGMGVQSTTPDADFLPPGIIERVEIVPDGGSALYGSDAVAGVVNFVTRKRFDGVSVDARYGFGKDYHTFDANATIGKEWSDGSIWVSYNRAENGSILGGERAYNATPESIVGGAVVRDLECTSANVLVSGVNLGIPGLTPPTPALYAAPVTAAGRNTSNICDLTDTAAIYPDQRRNSVYAGLNQQLTDRLEVNLRAFYYDKHSYHSLGKFFGSVNIGPSFLAPFGFVSSPYTTFVTGYPGETQQVSFALDEDYVQTVDLNAWGFTPTFNLDLGGGWQMRGLAGYSESKSISHTTTIAPASVLNPLVVSGEFNPYAPTTASASVLSILTDYESYGRADQRQFNARLSIDGSLFELPGGAVKVAIGGEFLDEAYDSRKGNTVPANFLQLPKFKQSRNVKSVFGEIVAPVIGTESGLSLLLSAAGRYDHYSDVGGTFNPKFGATFKPVDWVSIRGSWGKSFVAPSLADSAVADPTAASFQTGAVANFLAPPDILAANGYPAIGPGQAIIILLGANPGLIPQKATNWSVGADINPPFIPGLRLSATYYNLTYTRLIQGPPFTNQPLYFATFADTTFLRSPSQQVIDEILSSAGSVGGSCAPMPDCVYAIQDVRKRNLGGFKQSGIDFSATYNTDTSFGSVDFGAFGTYLLTRKNAAVTGDPYVSELDTFNSRLKIRTNLGANIGNLRAQATWNFSQGFDVPPTGLDNQTHVGDFSTVDLYFRYDVRGEGLMDDLSFNLTVTNLFDEDPPLYAGGGIVKAQRGFRNGNTVGRLVQVGIAKKF
ncbi:MAG: TonB-dependent receptor [Novosphingobium sp.]|nr:TonB-dependent receptor [Novosphingobium sp.]